MNGKMTLLMIFVFAGIGCGIVKDWKHIEILWIYQVGFLLTANLMMLEYAWRNRHRTRRLFVFPVIGIFGITMIIAGNLAF